MVLQDFAHQHSITTSESTKTLRLRQHVFLLLLLLRRHSCNSTSVKLSGLPFACYVSHSPKCPLQALPALPEPP